MKLNGLENFFKTNENGEIEDFTQVNLGVDLNPLNFAFYYNEEYDLFLKPKQFEYLIKKSNLKQIDNNGTTSLMYALQYNKEENLHLTNQHWNYLINNSDLSLINDKEELSELKKIQSKLLNEEILNKIDIKENTDKKNKI